MDNLNNSDKNISLPFEVDENLEEIEVLEDPKKTAKEVIKDKAAEIKTNIQNQDIYESNVDIPIIKSNTPVKKKMDKALKVQIALVIIWVALTVGIYFFGYELFEPFIPIN